MFLRQCLRLHKAKQYGTFWISSTLSISERFSLKPILEVGEAFEVKTLKQQLT